MNDLLKDTLTERAAGVEPPPLDLDGIIAAGNHRLSRRRVLTIFGGTAVTLAGGTLAVAAARKRHVPPLFSQRRVTYAVGSELHYGDETISVAPHRVVTFVQTDAGFVFLNSENAIHVVDHDGVRSLSKSAWRLTGGDSGNLVAWVEGFNDRYESVVYDVAARRELVRTGIGNRVSPNLSLVADPRVVALDGDHAYFGTLQGLYRWDLTTDRGELIAKVGPEIVRTVGAGQLVFQQPFDKYAVVNLAIGPTISATAPVKFTGQQAFLSPTAAYLVTEPDDARPVIQPVWSNLQLFDATTGTHVALPSTYLSMFFGQWLDDVTCTIAAERQSGELDLLVVNARTSSTKIAVPAFTKLTFNKVPARTASFALPTGTPITDLY
ncbi:hypothetical protein ACFV9C_12670 [Kribbella sp. NPDC059898]|uniref:hypothetical protein n=1 Tax=Kribbella sp. NPDC059898 TaxID=3346995 RepID=UPI00365B9C2B